MSTYVPMIWNRRTVRMDVNHKYTAMAFVLKKKKSRKGRKLVGSRIRAGQQCSRCRLPPPSLPPSLPLSSCYLFLSSPHFFSHWAPLSSAFIWLQSFNFPLNNSPLSSLQVELSFLASCTSGPMIQASLGRETHLYGHRGHWKST